MQIFSVLQLAGLLLLSAVTLAMADDRAECTFSDKPEAYDACSRLISGRQLRGQALADVYLTRGKLLYHYRNDADGAIADASQAIALVPNFAQAYVDRGFRYANRKNDYDRAIADYTRALQIDPGNVEALTDRASAHDSKRDYDR